MQLATKVFNRVGRAVDSFREKIPDVEIRKSRSGKVGAAFVSAVMLGSVWVMNAVQPWSASWLGQMFLVLPPIGIYWISVLYRWASSKLPAA